MNLSNVGLLSQSRIVSLQENGVALVEEKDVLCDRFRDPELLELPLISDLMSKEAAASLDDDDDDDDAW